MRRDARRGAREISCKASGASRREVANVCLASLRANGSRECAPDDRLREAIHGRNKKKDGLLRFARNDGF